MSLPNALHRPCPEDIYTGEGGEVAAWTDSCETLHALGHGATMTDDERAAVRLQHDTCGIW